MLFQGGKITVVREALAFAIYMLTFTSLRRRLTPLGRVDPPLPVDLLAGGLAGMTSWSLTMPVDVVKSRLQSDCPMDLTSSRTGRLSTSYYGIIDCFIRSWHAEGLSVFFRGMMVTCMRAFPTNAVVLVIYVNSLRFLDG